MMRDSEQSSLQVENRNSATMTLKALSSVSVTELKSTLENVDDEEMAEENFHLHLSEDEDDDKTEKQNGESDEMIENEVLNKFDTADDVCMESIDEKTEDELLNDDQTAKSGAPVGVSKSREEKSTENIQEGEIKDTTEKSDKEKVVPVEEEKLTPEAEVPTVEEEEEKEPEQEKVIQIKKEVGITQEENVTPEKEMDTREDEIVSQEEEKITIKEEKLDDENEEVSEITEENSVAVKSETNKKDASTTNDGSVNSGGVSEKKKKEGEGGEETEQTNAEILKNQIMDTEDLLQIVDNDTEENDKESNDKIESEDNEAETDKNEEEDEPEQDEDSQSEKKTSDDGVDIEESSLSKDATDVDMDREYQSIVDDAITKENEEKDKKSESESEVTEETPCETPVDESMDESINGSMDIDEDENKENNEEAVNTVATPEKDEETSEPPKKDETDSTRNITSVKRTLSEENLKQDAKKIKLSTEEDVAKELPTITEPPVDSEEEKKRTEAKQVVLGTVGTYLKKNCLKNLCYEDLEEICMQKVCEAICYKSEIGELRHQLGVQEQMAEMWRKEVAQLSKQARDLEIVNKRLLHEVRLKNEREKPLVPVKITRSVGLQVRSDMLPNVVASKQRRLNRSPATASPAFNQKPPVRSPLVNNSNNRINKLPVQNRPQQNMARVSPVQNAKVKVANQKSCLLSQALQNATNAAANATGASTTTPTVANQTVTTPTTVSVPVSTSTATPAKTAIPVNRIAVKKPALTTKQVIDLTDEDIITTTSSRSTPGTTKNTMVSKAVTTTAGVRILTSAIKPGVLASGQVVPTTNASRFMYLYNNNQLLTADGKPTSQKVMFKIGSGNGVLASVANGSAIAVNTGARTAQQVAQLKLTSQQGTASVTTTNAITRAPASKVHVSKHPAPLPAPPITQNSQPARKPIPPKPHLSIKRSGGGIVLSWRMPYNLDNFESIVSYQLYAYQETTSPPSSDMWRKVGDVKALALPMACTLTQFADGNKYHFAVRAVDVHKRMGPFSAPEQILL